MYHLHNARNSNNFSRQGFPHSSGFCQLKPPVFSCTPQQSCTSPLSTRRTIICSATSSNLEHPLCQHPNQRVGISPDQQQPQSLNTPPPSPQDLNYHILEDDSYSISLAPPPMASITRIAYSVTQPARAARTISQTTTRTGGGGGSTPLSFPSSLLVIALTLVTAAYTAVRQRIATVKQCSSCRGYGIQRCKLCSGQGTIEWEGKMKHTEPCPLCLGKRFNKCSCCGGVPVFAHRMFRHADKADKLLGKLAASSSVNEGRKRLKIDPSTVVDAPSVRRKNKKNGVVSDQRTRTRVTLDDSEAWMEEVMMD